VIVTGEAGKLQSGYREGPVGPGTQPSCWILIFDFFF
jgi:hypothetical protein